jgi:hypothetical protein
MDNPETLTRLGTHGQSRDIGKIRHARHRTKTNKTQKVKFATEKRRYNGKVMNIISCNGPSPTSITYTFKGRGIFHT